MSFSKCDHCCLALVHNDNHHTVVGLSLHLICIHFKDLKCREFLREHLHYNDSCQADVVKWCSSIQRASCPSIFLKFQSQMKLLWSVIKINVFPSRKCLKMSKLSCECYNCKKFFSCGAVFSLGFTCKTLPF